MDGAGFGVCVFGVAGAAALGEVAAAALAETLEVLLLSADVAAGLLGVVGVAGGVVDTSDFLLSLNHLVYLVGGLFLSIGVMRSTRKSTYFS